MRALYALFVVLHTTRYLATAGVTCMATRPTAEPQMLSLKDLNMERFAIETNKGYNMYVRGGEVLEHATYPNK